MNFSRPHGADGGYNDMPPPQFRSRRQSLPVPQEPGIPIRDQRRPSLNPQLEGRVMPMTTMPSRLNTPTPISPVDEQGEVSPLSSATAMPPRVIGRLQTSVPFASNVNSPASPTFKDPFALPKMARPVSASTKSINSIDQPPSPTSSARPSVSSGKRHGVRKMLRLGLGSSRSSRRSTSAAPPASAPPSVHTAHSVPNLLSPTASVRSRPQQRSLSKVQQLMGMDVGEHEMLQSPKLTPPTPSHLSKATSYVDAWSTSILNSDDDDDDDDLGGDGNDYDHDQGHDQGHEHENDQDAHEDPVVHQSYSRRESYVNDAASMNSLYSQHEEVDSRSMESPRGHSRSPQPRHQSQQPPPQQHRLRPRLSDSGLCLPPMTRPFEPQNDPAITTIVEDADDVDSRLSLMTITAANVSRQSRRASSRGSNMSSNSSKRASHNSNNDGNVQSNRNSGGLYHNTAREIASKISYEKHHPPPAPPAPGPPRISTPSPVPSLLSATQLQNLPPLLSGPPTSPLPPIPVSHSSRRSPSPNPRPKRAPSPNLPPPPVSRGPPPPPPELSPDSPTVGIDTQMSNFRWPSLRVPDDPPPFFNPPAPGTETAETMETMETMETTGNHEPEYASRPGSGAKGKPKFLLFPPGPGVSTTNAPAPAPSGPVSPPTAPAAPTTKNPATVKANRHNTIASLAGPPRALATVQQQQQHQHHMRSRSSGSAGEATLHSTSSSSGTSSRYSSLSTFSVGGVSLSGTSVGSVVEEEEFEHEAGQSSMHAGHLGLQGIHSQPEMPHSAFDEDDDEDDEHMRTRDSVRWSSLGANIGRVFRRGDEEKEGREGRESREGREGKEKEKESKHKEHKDSKDLIRSARHRMAQATHKASSHMSHASTNSISSVRDQQQWREDLKSRIRVIPEGGEGGMF